MKHLLITIAAAALSASALASQPLLSASELESARASTDLRVIDIRDPASYSKGHIEGSISAPYGKWRGPKNNPGDLPELTQLTKLVQSLGLTQNTHAVIVSSGANDTDFGAAARVYWTLKVLGLTELSILNGGIKAWQSQGLALSTAPVSVKPSEFAPTINTNLITTQADLTSNISPARKILLVDARPEDFFNGNTRHAAAKVAGTLEGAVNVPHSLWFEPGSSKVVSADKAIKLAREHNLDQQNTEIISFCNTGHWAATNWFVLSELVADQDVKLYPGSMVEWTRSGDALPVQNMPGRLKQLWIDAKLWFASL